MGRGAVHEKESSRNTGKNYVGERGRIRLDDESTLGGCVLDYGHLDVVGHGDPFGTESCEWIGYEPLLEIRVNPAFRDHGFVGFFVHKRTDNALRSCIRGGAGRCYGQKNG